MKTILTLDKANIPYGFFQLDGNSGGFVNGLTATTISGTTYYGLPTDVTVTGGTLSNGIVTMNNNIGGTFTISGFSTTNNGTTSLDFGFSNGLEGDYTMTGVTNPNITSDSQVLINVIPSTDHNEIEDSLLDGLDFRVSNIIDGVGFDIHSYAKNGSWGIYNIRYKIIN